MNINTEKSYHHVNLVKIEKYGKGDVIHFCFLFIVGIGYALAKEFLREGDNVVICSRSGQSIFWSCKTSAFCGVNSLPSPKSTCNLTILYDIGFLLYEGESVAKAVKSLTQEFGGQRAFVSSQFAN